MTVFSLRLIRPISLASWLGAVLLAWPVLAGAAGTVGEVGFYDQIKPLLAVHCYGCHGPETAKAALRLDRRERALTKGESGAIAVVPGASARSEMIRRITSDDPDERMPPKGERLSAADVERVRAWIDQGARWP